MERRTINILLVEDDEVDIMNVRRAFQYNKILNPLYVARNGLEALAMLRDQDEARPTLSRGRRIVLLDISMPKMNGIEFLQELRKDPQLASTPVVVLTTSDEDQDRMDAYRLNVAGYILKPVKFANFTEVMATLDKYWTLCEMP